MLKLLGHLFGCQVIYSLVLCGAFHELAFNQRDGYETLSILSYHFECTVDVMDQLFAIFVMLCRIFSKVALLLFCVSWIICRIVFLKQCSWAEGSNHPCRASLKARNMGFFQTRQLRKDLNP